MVLAVLLALAPVITLADVLILDEVKQADSMNLPGNGQSKAVIESTYGAPTHKHAAVGDPPITRWDYDSFSVYFEYDLVLSTVLHPGAVITGS
jgi:hypothetical protein